MAGNAHAASMLIFVGIGLYLVAIGRGQGSPWSPWRRLLVGSGGVALLVVFGFVMHSHMCGAGNATRQWLVMVSLWMLAALRVTRTRVLALAFVASFGGSVLLSAHYNTLVHGTAYTGNPRWALFTARSEQVRVISRWHTRLSGLYEVERSLDGSGRGSQP